MVNLLAFVGVVFITVLCLVAYAPIQAKLSTPEFLSLSYGLLISRIFPILLTLFGVMFSLVIMLVSTRLDNGAGNK